MSSKFSSSHEMSKLDFQKAVIELEIKKLYETLYTIRDEAIKKEQKILATITDLKKQINTL